MPLRRRLARKAMAAAAAHSRMSFRFLSRQEDKDKALKLVSHSADTKLHAQWPKTGMERQKENPCWGCLLTTDEVKFPQNFQKCMTRYAEKPAATPAQSCGGRFAQVTLDEGEIPVIDTVCSGLGAGFNLSEQVYDLWISSSQTCAT